MEISLSFGTYHFTCNQSMYTTGIQQPQYQTNVPINLQTIPNYQAPPPQPIQYQNVVYQTHTDHVIHSRAPRNIIVQWIPQRKLYHSGFDSHYPLDLSQHMDINEFANLIRECTVRFRQVAQPWRVFWKKQKKMMPVEIVAAVATFCLSMFVSIPLWHRGYGKAMVCRNCIRADSRF